MYGRTAVQDCRSESVQLSCPLPKAPPRSFLPNALNHNTKRKRTSHLPQAAFSDVVFVARLEIFDAAVCVRDRSAGASSWTFCFLGTRAYQYNARAARTLKMMNAHMMPKLRHRVEYCELSAVR